ncbi:hypothetical protein CC2G_001328 [Coprinopsis cinerea AmutBmut pab1-1]|nr:hypothetical protein CC2G_001328 [Coprinopsis cinerea AmutBmut pab1-1]
MLHNLSMEDDTPLGTINEDDNDDTPPSPSEAQAARQKAIIDEAARELAKTRMSYLLGTDDPTNCTYPTTFHSHHQRPTHRPEDRNRNHTS